MSPERYLVVKLSTIVLTVLLLRLYIQPKYLQNRRNNMSGTAQRRTCVQTLGTKPRDIICLLVGAVANVQAPRRLSYQQLVCGSSVCGCGSSNLEPPDHENNRRKSSFAMAILL